MPKTPTDRYNVCPDTCDAPSAHSHDPDGNYSLRPTFPCRTGCTVDHAHIWPARDDTRDGSLTHPGSLAGHRTRQPTKGQRQPTCPHDCDWRTPHIHHTDGTVAGSGFLDPCPPDCDWDHYHVSHGRIPPNKPLDRGDVAVTPEPPGAHIRRDDEPSIVINHGSGYIEQYTDSYIGLASRGEVRPIRRAVTIARLRALADLLESETQ